MLTLLRLVQPLEVLLPVVPQDLLRACVPVDPSRELQLFTGMLHIEELDFEANSALTDRGHTDSQGSPEKDCLRK
eukprot:6005857-Amphidinium_carterae.1